MPGPATSEAEVTNISAHGFWLLLDGRELFLPFDEFPWFKRAPVEAILRLERPAAGHLYWPGSMSTSRSTRSSTQSATRSRRRPEGGLVPERARVFGSLGWFSS